MAKKKTTKKGKATGSGPAKKAAKRSKRAASQSAAETAATESAKTKKKTEPRVRDPRLPEAGTVLQKKDRHGVVRCECTVDESTVRYAGTDYRSLSAAAMAAAKDLGLGGRAQNGFTFWGLSTAPRRVGDPVATLVKVWERYQGRATALVSTAVNEENRERFREAFEKHAGELAKLAKAV